MKHTLVEEAIKEFENLLSEVTYPILTGVHYEVASQALIKLLTEKLEEVRKETIEEVKEIVIQQCQNTDSLIDDTHFQQGIDYACEIIERELLSKLLALNKEKNG